MSVTCQFNGRLGNITINICQVIGYAKKHNLTYWFPQYAWACDNGISTITVPDTADPLDRIIQSQYYEPMDNGHPYYHDIPYMNNVEFRGYFQSFKYFDEYRQDILKIFNFPHQIEKGIVGVSSRRGDCINQMVPGTNDFAFPIAPREYYQTAIRYMQERGYNTFRIYGDDINWHRGEFTTDNYPDAQFEFSEGLSILDDYKSLQQCEHQITARSTFSLTAGWLNQNPDKIILCPTGKIDWWFKKNTSFFTGTEYWLTQLEWK